MTMPTLRPLALALVLLPLTGLAQGSAASTTEKVPPAPIDEVERGFYLGVNAGAFYLLNAPGAAGTPRPASLGQQAQVELGYDLGDRLSIGLFLTGTANKAGSDYLGYSNGAASGDFSALVPGAVARFHALGFKDGQGVERTWVYLRAGAGYAMFFPRQLLPDADILVFGGPGVEYYTRLRHFSVGIELTGTFLVNSGAMGVSVTPNLRYAFSARLSWRTMSSGARPVVGVVVSVVVLVARAVPVVRADAEAEASADAMGATVGMDADVVAAIAPRAVVARRSGSRPSSVRWRRRWARPISPVRRAPSSRW